MFVQGYITEKYSEELLQFIYLECSSNEWDYLVSLDSVEEVEDFIEPHKQALIWIADLK